MHAITYKLGPLGCPLRLSLQGRWLSFSRSAGVRSLGSAIPLPYYFLIFSKRLKNKRNGSIYPDLVDTLVLFDSKGMVSCILAWVNWLAFVFSN